jgi:hypothetical protein
LKKIVWLGAVLFCVAACGNKAKVESEVESLKASPDSSAGRTSDSAKAKGEQTLEAIREKVKEIKIDSVGIRPDDSINNL